MKITANINTGFAGYETKIFTSRSEFDAERKRLYDQINTDSQGNRLATGWYAREIFRDEYPDLFPCLMIYRPETTDGGDGPRIIENFFLYDFEIHEDEEV